MITLKCFILSFFQNFCTLIMHYIFMNGSCINIYVCIYTYIVICYYLYYFLVLLLSLSLLSQNVLTIAEVACRTIVSKLISGLMAISSHTYIYIRIYKHTCVCIYTCAYVCVYSCVKQ